MKTRLGLPRGRYVLTITAGAGPHRHTVLQRTVIVTTLRELDRRR